MTKFVELDRDPRNFSEDNPGSAEETFVFPASVEQHRYWTLSQLDSESTASNMAISFEISGPVDEMLVEQAVAALVLRHEALRTVFRLRDGRLVQVVLSRAMYAFAVSDLTSVPSEEQTTVLADCLNEHSHVRIDLQSGPVLKARLIRLAPESHVLAFTMHHIVCDGWSNGVLVRDFALLYEAFKEGRNSCLPELPFQFADYVLWQAEYLASSRADDALKFWKSHIGRDVPALNMPADRKRTPGRSFPGHIESCLLPAALNASINQYCRSSGSTKHIVLLAAFQALCSRYADQSLYLLGSTIAGRTQPGMDDVVGRFANPQVVVADVTGNPTFRELEIRVRNWETTAYTHQDLPFSRIVEAFQVNRAGTASQFLQVWFVYQKAFMQPQKGSSIEITPRRSVSGGVDFDMLVSVVERAEGPRVQIEYNTSLFTSERIRDLIAAYTRLLEAALHTPDTHLADFKLDERPIPAVLPQVSATTAQKATGSALFTPGKSQCSGSSDRAAIAVSQGTAALSWGELEEQSDAVAARLITMAAAGDPVLIACQPRTETIVALSAVLKAGLSPVLYPKDAGAEQFEQVAKRAGASVTLAPQSWNAKGSSSIAFEDFPEFSSTSVKQPLALAPNWFSCSFNTEKGIVLSAHPLPAAVESHSQLCGGLRLTQDASLLSVALRNSHEYWLDLMLALVSGARLTFWNTGDEEGLQSVLNRRQVTAVLATPSVWRRLTSGGWTGDKRVTAIVRGEAACVLPALPKLVSSAWRVHHSEVTGDVLGIARLTDSSGEQIEILCESSLTLVDSAGSAVPSGAIGEFATASGRTGLLGLKGRNGAYRGLGPKRKFQHLHGQRVRLQDLEEAILQHPDILEVEALVQPDTSGRERLTAWVASISGSPVVTELLRESLGRQLPPDLVPAEVISLPSLPRHFDGSFAESRVPQPAETTPVAIDTGTTGTAYCEIENRLQEIWKEVLGVKTLNTHTSFFDLGGTSLLLVRLFAKINKEFSTSLPITAIFDARTVSELAAQLRKQTDVRSIVAVQAQGHKQPLFMVHSYLLYQGLSRTLGTDQPLYGLRETDQDSHLTVEERVTKYVREIRNVQPRGPYAVAGWCAAGPLTVEVARQLIEGGCEVSAVILFDSWLPGYLASIEGQQQRRWAPNTSVLKSKLHYHLRKLEGLSIREKRAYARAAMYRLVRERRDKFFLHHWSAIDTLSKHFHIQLPQFMHNTSLQTFAALREYKEQSVPTQITLIRASDSREVKGADVSCGWNRIAEHGVRVLWAPGDHETMFVGRNLEATGDLVCQALADRDRVPAQRTGLPEDIKLAEAGAF